MRQHPADDGFSLVELIIAMFFLAILSLAVLPLLIGAASSSVANRDQVKATSFATQQLASLRAGFPLDAATTCSALSAREANAASPIAGPSGSGMTATIDVASCPTSTAAYPVSIDVTIRVFGSSGDELTSLPTQFRVASR